MAHRPVTVPCEFDEHNDAILICPKCKNGNLHMERVVTFFDEKIEDSGKTKTEVTRTSTTETSKCSQGEFDVGRRDLLVVEFVCEHCSLVDGHDDKKLHLHVKQHKGETQVEWK